MDGNLTEKAVLSGRVNAIPLIDSTLTEEGQAADAKATGDKLTEQQGRIDNMSTHLSMAKANLSKLEDSVNEHTATLAGHEASIATNKTGIGRIQNTLSASQVRLDIAEGNIETLNEQMGTANETIAGLGEGMTTAEEAIVDLRNNDISLSGNITAVDNALATERNKLDAIIGTVNETVTPGLNKANSAIGEMQDKLDNIDLNQINGLVDDMADVKTKLGVSYVTFTPDAAEGVTVRANSGYKNGAVCTITFEIINSTGTEIGTGETLCTGLPKPCATVFAHGVNFSDDSICPFTIFANGSIAPFAKPLPIGKAYITATYVVADE